MFTKESVSIEVALEMCVLVCIIVKKMFHYLACNEKIVILLNLTEFMAYN